MADDQKERVRRYRATAEGKSAYAASQASSRRVDPEGRRVRATERRYAMSAGAYASMLTVQNNACALCLRPFGSAPAMEPAVDHDHATGKVRGILHNKCNVGLGFFEDDPALLEMAKFYLKWMGDKR